MHPRANYKKRRSYPRGVILIINSDAATAPPVALTLLCCHADVRTYFLHSSTVPTAERT